MGQAKQRGSLEERTEFAKVWNEAHMEYKVRRQEQRFKARQEARNKDKEVVIVGSKTYIPVRQLLTISLMAGIGHITYIGK